MPEHEIDHVVVVIPARDEEATIAVAVDAVRTAAVNLPAPATVDVVVVADACSDRTVELASEAGAHVIVCDEGNVGAARALGCAWALDRAHDVGALWLALTDADSIVPADWLARHVEEARAGADVLLGTVELEAAEARRHPRWLLGYRRRRTGADHGHVHGANLGVRATAYLAVGGFLDLPLHEDVDLVTRLLADGATPAWVDDVAVTTSARHLSRVTGGVASDLAAGADVDTAPGRIDVA
ncbi:glycosyltransferase [Aeromicrobium sp. Leaf350]|uniref:glycosyltransferase n=1 Tax=Aeromicrobium sp. Leaf350 TaxID=2876565 RepID=UPI001E547DCB|nr:glycosyltransferase [Aeromicrobium sp. Leaf350]